MFNDINSVLGFVCFFTIQFILILAYLASYCITLNKQYNCLYILLF